MKSVQRFFCPFRACEIEGRPARPWFTGVPQEQDQLMEKVGAELRSKMPFLNPVNIKQQ